MVRFSVASMNILADPYIASGDYSTCDQRCLWPGWRWPAIAAHLLALDADVIAIQEATAQSMTVIRGPLEHAGYEVIFVPKSGGRPDGCGLAVRQSRLRLEGLRAHYYRDGLPGQDRSGCLAMFAEISAPGLPRLVVATTHLRWSPHEPPHEQRIGYRQMAELLEVWSQWFTTATPGIICGDLNAKADTPIVQMPLSRDWRDTYASRPGDHTCRTHAVPKRIDFLLHTPHLLAEPTPLPAVESNTPLPSPSQPSDHLAVRGVFSLIS